MKDNLTSRYNGNVAVNADEVLRETAFIYLKEALAAQRYEECASLIESARELGATQGEISAILSGYNRGYPERSDNEAKSRKGQPRF